MCLSKTAQNTSDSKQPRENTRSDWLKIKFFSILQLILNNCFSIIFRAEQRELQHKNTDGIVCLYALMSHYDSFNNKLVCQGGSVVEWFRALDLISGGSWFLVQILHPKRSYVKLSKCKTEKDFRGSRFFIGGPYLMEQSAPSYPSCGQL